jgi:hypothetical protein
MRRIAFLVVAAMVAGCSAAATAAPVVTNAPEVTVAPTATPAPTTPATVSVTLPPATPASTVPPTPKITQPPQPTPAPTPTAPPWPLAYQTTFCRMEALLSVKDEFTGEMSVEAILEARWLMEAPPTWTPGADALRLLYAVIEGVPELLSAMASSDPMAEVDARGHQLDLILTESAAYGALHRATGFVCPGDESWIDDVETPAPTAAPTPTPKPAKVSGKGTMNTAPFTLKAGDYRVDWKATCDGNFIARLDAPGESFGETIANEIINGSETGRTNLYGLGGRYYVAVISMCSSWTVTFTRQ